MRFRQIGCPNNLEILIRAYKEPLVQQTPPAPIKRSVPVARIRERVPRITKLLALALRLEELLRQGTAKDYADLARLGGVSRARIQNAPNLPQRTFVDCLSLVRVHRQQKNPLL
jgi:hypothetical protein